MLIRSDCKIILASTSSVRKKILEEVGLEFTVIAPTYDEDSEKKNLTLSPEKLAVFLAKEKALSISGKFPDAVVIGSDQVCEFEGEEVSKSQNANQAISQLQKFNGKTHFQNNAVCVTRGDEIIFQSFSRVKLKMRNLSEEEISSYVNEDKSWFCAGSYKYESLGKHLFEEIDGDYYSILGLAIQPLISFFHQKKIISINS